MSSILNADLHCHSVVSDGTLTPEELAARAAANGVELWALTDHDEVGGQHRAAAAARANGLRYLTGTEISVTFANETVHIVGLGFDPDDAAMTQGLYDTRGGRGKRAQEMAEGLAKVGIHGAYEGALKFVGNPELISRTHFARFLVEQGHCRDTPRGVSQVPDRRQARLRAAPLGLAERRGPVGSRAAKGMAVIAHPGRYKFTANEEYALFLEFKAHGGQAIEVVTGSHTTAEYVEYADKALEFDFAASRGSDFHSPDESHCDLGKLPPLPGALTPVWELLSHRIQQ